MKVNVVAGIVVFVVAMVVMALVGAGAWKVAAALSIFTLVGAAIGLMSADLWVRKAREEIDEFVDEHL